MRGGHAHSGPPPDPNALRRERDAVDWVRLPASGREGPPPPWPLSRATKREVELWEREWRRPQAIVWEKRGQEMEVALYVRNVRQGEKPGAPIALGNLIQRMADSLGLTSAGLRANRWTIVGDEMVGQPAPTPDKPRPPRRPSSRERLRVVSDEGA